MKKVIIVCGPNLMINMGIPHVVIDNLEEAVHSQYRFPERQFGAAQVRSLTREAVVGTTNGVIFFTRYGDVISEVGAMIEEGVISKDDVEICLETMNESGIRHYNVFEYSKDGFIEGKWPYGVLG